MFSFSSISFSLHYVILIHINIIIYIINIITANKIIAIKPNINIIIIATYIIDANVSFLSSDISSNMTILSDHSN